MLTLYSLLWWLQPAPSTAQKATEVAQKAPGPAGCDYSSVAFLGVTLVIFYFLLIRPQQKRQKEHDALLRGLKRGDMVRTSGGVRGEVIEVGEVDATIQVADKVKINVLRSHISGLDKPPTDKK